MLNSLKPMTAIGLEIVSDSLEGAKVSLQPAGPFIHGFVNASFSSEDKRVKRLYKSKAVIVTGLQGRDVLVRHLHLPLFKQKDIESALAFQAEPLLPYSAETSCLAWQSLGQDAEGTSLTLLASPQDLIAKHLELWRSIKIEPEIVSCVQMALCQFGRYYIKTENAYGIFHLSEKFTTGALIKEGKLLTSYTHQEGLDLLFQAHAQDAQPEPLEKIDFNTFDFATSPALHEAVKRLQAALAKIHYALSKEVKGAPLEGILVTGEALRFHCLDQCLTSQIQLPLLVCEPFKDGRSSQEKQRRAAMIGLALGGLSAAKEKINFRQKELSYPYPWKKLTLPLLVYFACMTLLTISFYFFGHYRLLSKEDQLRQDYVDLLGAMSKPYEKFEIAFLDKHPAAREQSNGEAVAVSQLKKEDLLQRLQFLQKDLQSTPDSFPLFANIPRVSDVLAWLSQHPYVARKDENGRVEPRLQLENFSYAMLKRPVQGKKQEKYQVKVELEFSSPTPKWAREFHDALIAANDWVDPKGEVKWSSNRGRYRTSFFLKDKTSYPTQ